jgi:peptide/nickel transport system permease protein
MRGYIIRRIALLVPTLFLVTVVVFLSVRLIPGDVVEMMVTEHAGFEEVSIEEIRHDMGLDLPVHVQYGRWVKGIVTRGDLGKSLWTGRSATDEIRQRLPVSFELGLLSIAVGLTIAVPVGMYSAIRQDTPGDYLGRVFAIACIALPTFWTGTLVVVFPAVWWGWSPSVEYIPFIEDPLGNLQQFIVPAILLGMSMSGTTMRMTRTMMLEVLRQDYIRTAWAKGLSERTLILRHALKNALIPVVTIVGLQLPILIGGSIILENIFSLPGIGVLTVQIINSRDYNVLSGINLFMAFTVLLINLMVDLAYGFLDPRVHYG